MGRLHGVSSFELPRAVLLDSERWTPQNGLLTPSFKTSRIGLRAKYGKKLAKKHASALGEELSLSQSQDGLSTSAILEIVSKGGQESRKQTCTFASLLKQFTGKELSNVSPSVRIGELGIDSVGVVLFQNTIVSKLGVNVPFDVLLGLGVGEVDRFIAKAQTRRMQTHVAMEADNDIFEKDINLPGLFFLISSILFDVCVAESIVFRSSASVEQSHEVVLTGASGFLGCFILRELLMRNPHVVVRALVRSKEKLKDDVQKYGVIEKTTFFFDVF